MAYKKYIVYKMESFKPNLIIKDLFNGESAIVVVKTEDFEINEGSAVYLTAQQLQNMEKLIKLNDRVNYLISHSIVNIFYCNLMDCILDNLTYHYNSYGKK